MKTLGVSKLGVVKKLLRLKAKVLSLQHDHTALVCYIHGTRS